MAADMSGEQMQAKIAAARREAEGLKDKIKRRKDELADTTRTDPIFAFFQTSCEMNSHNAGSWPQTPVAVASLARMSPLFSSSC